MANMSYCRFQNTLSDLNDCVEWLEKNKVSDLSKALTSEMKEKSLRESGFFCGGLTDEQIEYYYDKYLDGE